MHEAIINLWKSCFRETFNVLVFEQTNPFSNRLDCLQFGLFKVKLSLEAITSPGDDIF